MQLSRVVTGTALLLERHAPSVYASIRNNALRRLRSAINTRMTIDSLGTDSPKQVFTNIFRKNWWNNGESRSGWGAELKRTVSIRAERQNTDIKYGQVRHLNLCAPPFGLPQPFAILREDDDPNTGRVIGVWRRPDIE